jgi:hemoglobin
MRGTSRCPDAEVREADFPRKTLIGTPDSGGAVARWESPAGFYRPLAELPNMSDETLYDRLGGREGIRAVVDDFYDRLVADDELGPFFADADVAELRRTQTDFLCEAAGGPETYDAAPVREAHLHVPFTPAHIERAVALLYESLDEYDVPSDDADSVVEAVAAHEADLLAEPTDE